MSFLKKISFFLVFVFCLGFMISCFGSSPSGNKISLSTDEIYEKVTNGIDVSSLQKVTQSELEDLFNLKSSDLEEITLYKDMGGTTASEIVVFKFSNKKQEAAIDKAIGLRLEGLNTTWSTYSPEQHELVKNVKKFSYGNVKGYVISNDASKIISNIDKLLK